MFDNQELAFFGASIHRVALGYSDIDRTKLAIQGVTGKRLIIEPDFSRFVARVARRWRRDAAPMLQPTQLELPFDD